jgi:dTDP-4-dehydrorhamnose 3,5-epimerase-like enzyme
MFNFYMKLIELKVISDLRGSLCVIEDHIGFDIKRVYYMYRVSGRRGGHAHKITKQALITVSGSCDVPVFVNNNWQSVTLNDPSKCLILAPEDFHYMNNFSDDCVLLVLASEHYDKDDYIYEKGENV